MKRALFFHRINAPLDTDHVIYKVWAGESVREQRLLARLMAWAFEHGATLRSWSEDVDYYLQLEAERVFPSRGILDFGFIRADLNVREALELAEGDKFPKFESELAQPKGFFHHLLKAEPSKLDTATNRIRNHQVPTSPRKNLSERYDNGKFIISFI